MWGDLADGRGSPLGPVANIRAPVSSRHQRGARGRFQAVPTPYRGRTNDSEKSPCTGDLASYT
jgi:hypothetical protein